MKRRISLLLTLTLCGAVPVPMGTIAVAAESPVDQQLAQVTEIVKKKLNIGSQYTDFSGTPTENGLFSSWSLNWSNAEKESLQVKADSNGKILSYYLYRPRSLEGKNTALPSFPKVDRATAQQTAEKFVHSMLLPGESMAFNENNRSSLHSSNHGFMGKILLNGIHSPIVFTVSVDSETNEVISFGRTDGSESYYLGDIPSPKATASETDAAKLLKDTLKLRLEYVDSSRGGQRANTNANGNSTTTAASDSKTPEHYAVLRYLPEETDSYYVDAQTGKLVNLTELYRQVEADGSYFYNESAAAADTAASSGGSAPKAEPSLSEVEQAGVAKLKGVLTKEQLDQKLRAIANLGLADQAMTDFSYWVSDKDGQKSSQAAGQDGNQEAGQSTVYADLSYANKNDPDKRRTYFRVNARTGEIQYMSSPGDYQEDRTAEVTQEQAKQNAEQLLQSLWPKQAAELASYETNTDLPFGTYQFQFARQVNGYFFPDHSFTIDVDVTDGTIRGIHWNFDDTFTFQKPENLLSAEAALDAWFASYQTTLGYQLIPTALNPSESSSVDPQFQPLIDQGMKYYYKLGLTYQLLRDISYSSLDAVTGDLFESYSYRSGILTYSDIENAAAKKQIEGLAQYGVGYSGGTFQPDKELTQLDCLELLYKAQGYYYDEADAGTIENIYGDAYRQGLLTIDQRDENAVLTRGQTVKMLLDCVGYRTIAQLPNIFQCAFSDAADIPTEYYGYAALAQAMGIVPVNGAQLFAATRNATRSDLAVMLYNYMSR